MSVRRSTLAIAAALRGPLPPKGAVAPKTSPGIYAGLVLIAVAALLSVPVTAQAEACPNEQLRGETHSTNLPDCRAYELVTPPSKLGGPPQPEKALAANGEALSFTDLGAFGEPGGAHGTNGPTYVARRSNTGWTSTPVNPSATEFHPVGLIQGGGQINDFNEDLTKGLFFLAPASSTTIGMRAYLVGIGEPPKEVGPTVSPTLASDFTQADAEEYNKPLTDFAGASQDLSHVLFTLFNRGLTNWYWPGDTTEAKNTESLYEYVGTGNAEPELVGVSGGRGSKTLISECGDSLGAPASTDVYNAISSTGAVVFFTAEHSFVCTKAQPAVNKLFARVEGSATVSISEPVLPGGAAGECSAAEPCHEAEAKAATFQGASSDGRYVFFLSEQPLVNGAPSEGTKLYEERLVGTGEATEVAEVVDVSNLASPGTDSGVQGVARVSEDGSRLYFVAEGVLASNVDALGERPVQGQDNLYIYNTVSRRVTFIAALASGDSGDWSATDDRPVEATPDGEFLLIPSENRLTPDAHGPGIQLYRYDAIVGEANAKVEEEGMTTNTSPLVRVSIGQQAPGGYFCHETGEVEQGFNCDGNSAPYSFARSPEYTRTMYAAPQPRSMSDNGARVFFSSPAGLTPNALNEACVEVEGQCATLAYNIYEWEQAGTGTCAGSEAGTGCLYLISDGRDTHSGFTSISTVSFVGTDETGNNVFFTTADSLVASDTDTQTDIYDARVDGGFPAPAAPSHCQGEGCQGPPTTPPVFGAPGSATLSGPGNLAPPLTAPAAPVKKTAAQIRAEKLTKALKVCKKEPKKKRTRCEKPAKKRYGKAK